MLNFKPFNYHYEFLQVSKPLLHSITLKKGETLKAEVIDVLPTGGVVIKAKGIHITVQTEIPMKKDTHLLLKVLDTGEISGKVKLRIVSFSEKGINVSKLSSLEKEISNILKNSDLNVSFIEVLNSVSPQVKSRQVKQLIVDVLDKFLAEKNTKSTVFEDLKNDGFLTDRKYIPKEAFSKILKEKSVLIELFLKSQVLENFSKNKDLDKKKLKEIKTYVESYQVLSSLTGGLYSFIPVLFNDLKDGDIFFLKREKKGKKHFFCRINLNFEKEGFITTDIFLFEKDLMIDMFIESKKLKKKILKNKKHLEESLKNTGFRYVFINLKKEKVKLSKIVFEENLSVLA